MLNYFHSVARKKKNLNTKSRRQIHFLFEDTPTGGKKSERNVIVSLAFYLLFVGAVAYVFRFVGAHVRSSLTHTLFNTNFGGWK